MDKSEWQAISQQLKAPFAPAEVDFRVQGKATEQGRGQIVAYIDARAVQDRLDSVVGTEGWSFTWEPVAVVNGVVKVAKGSLRLLDLPPKEDVGDSGDIEPNKSAVSDALKRAAVQWGVGRYLYERKAVWVDLEKASNGWKIPDSVIAQQRAQLAQPAKAATARPAQAAGPLEQSRRPAPVQEAQDPNATEGEAPASEQQLQSIRKLCATLGREEPAAGVLTFNGAAALIRQLAKEHNDRRRSA